MTSVAYDLFNPPPAPANASAPPKRDLRSEFRRQVEQIAIACALDARDLGIIAEDVRLAAEREGVTPPTADPQRRWSCLAGILNALVLRGELVAPGFVRKAKRDAAHANASRVYLHRQWAGEPR